MSRETAEEKLKEAVFNYMSKDETSTPSDVENSDDEVCEIEGSEDDEMPKSKN